MTAIPKVKRYLNEDYLNYIREQKCLECGNNAEPHHWKTRGAGGSDLLAIPLCRRHHVEIGQIGSRFFDKYNWENTYIHDEMVRLLCGYIMMIDVE